MRFCDFYRTLEKYAPIRLSEEFRTLCGGYDNSGVLVETGKDISCALFSLDFSLAAVEKAIKRQANVIVTHHPAIFAKIGCVNESDLLGKKLQACIREGISVVSMHLNLDAAKGGTDEALAEAVCLAAEEKVCDRKDEAILYPVGGGYGRVYDLPKSVPLSSLADNLKKVLKSNNMLIFGKGDTPIARVASFCGAGADEEAIAFAERNGANAVISSDFKHHILSAALEKGLCVIAPTHYASERYGFQKYYEKISRETDVSCIFHEDETFL